MVCGRQIRAEGRMASCATISASSVADRKHGIQPPPTNTTVRSEDWYGQDVSGQTHTRVAFVDVDLTEATNQGATFAECTFRGVRFNVSRHADAAFLNCTFTRCVFFDATFTNCKLVGSMFDRCTHGLMKVTGGDWSFVGLPGADLRTASFSNVRMREADLTGARCQGATIRRVDLTGAWLHMANLSRCDLRGSDLSSVDPLSVELNGALISADQACVIAANLGLDVRTD